MKKRSKIFSLTDAVITALETCAKSTGYTQSHIVEMSLINGYSIAKILNSNSNNIPLPQSIDEHRSVVQPVQLTNATNAPNDLTSMFTAFMQFMQQNGQLSSGVQPQAIPQAIPTPAPLVDPPFIKPGRPTKDPSGKTQAQLKKELESAKFESEWQRMCAKEKRETEEALRKQFRRMLNGETYKYHNEHLSQLTLKRGQDNKVLGGAHNMIVLSQMHPESTFPDDTGFDAQYFLPVMLEPEFVNNIIFDVPVFKVFSTEVAIPPELVTKLKGGEKLGDVMGI